jgi:hypothetical protein
LLDYSAKVKHHGFHRNLFLLGGFILRLGASQHARHAMSQLSPGNAFLIAAIMGLSFLAEVTVFAVLGIF